MKTRPIFTTLLLSFVFVLAFTTAQAQVNTLAGLNASGTTTLKAYCPGDPVKLTAAATGAATYTWKRYAGPIVAGAATALAGDAADTQHLTDNITTPGYYTYVAIGLNSSNCESDVSAPITIYVLPGITATIVSSAPATTEYCVNQLPTSLTLTATAVNAVTVPITFGYTYQWFKGATAITGATGTTYTLNATDDVAAGTQAYTVKVTYKVNPSCTTPSNAISFNVVALPSQPIVTVQ